MPVTACDVLPTFVALAVVPPPLPAGVEGGSFAPVLRDPSGRGTIVRPREELVFHFPHYDMGNGGPATAILFGGYKLVRNYETGTRRLYDLERDPGESRDLAATQSGKLVELTARLDAYLASVNAQMAAKNPHYDPTKAPAADEGPPRKGGKAGKRRNDK